MFDVIVSGGLVVDGTGGPTRVADVAIGDGTIKVIGSDLGPAQKLIDASGCIVTPGFVDPHTHLDAELFWDPAATPSCLHGVTTVAISACGFGVAPCVPADREYILKSLEVVEEIPFTATDVSLPRRWGTWAEYVDALDALPLGVNVVSFVPHSPLRRAVLGKRARAAQLDSAEIAQIVTAYVQALDAGAIGFATSRERSHVDVHGDPMPSILALDEELAALVAASGGRAWQIAIEARMTDAPDAVTAAIDRYAEWTAAAKARLSWSSLVVTQKSDTWRRALRRSQEHQAAGCPLLPQVTPRPISVTICLSDNSSYRAMRTPGWEAVFQAFPHGRSTAERMAYVADEGFSAAWHRIDLEATAMTRGFDRWRIAFSPSRPESSGKLLSEVLPDTHDQIGGLIELLLADELNTVVEVPVVNDLSEEVAELCSTDGVLWGLGDSGAHVASVTSYCYPTFVLASFVRDQQAMSLQEAVHRMTAVPARFLGIGDRGELRPGQRADMCIIDFERLRLGSTERRKDLPGGHTRLFLPAHGYRAVLVNGRVAVEDDVALDRAAGRFLRL